ncbi:TIGR03621 family F420-dependent LLM class oxidoreductase [Actinomadura viridis]|uniref:F420-dependent oxidoreductase n=1 Tax=Actinomadura viridis TaxID=58110 RepID=A0A931GMK9_9ACTN|nr:TIGR03621 family F420-dependent LLM class oxidoreductase [Actinomadura viridis]MBG6092762.1 putative F420-dependent oxidoreductase [Actinomadura viridis]
MRTFRFGAVARLAATRREWVAKARRLEDAGFDVMLVPDHIVGPRFGPIAAMMAAADATTRLRVGTMVAANDFRHPVLLAKEAATLDVLSDGRLELGIGTGWLGLDYRGAGLVLDEPRVRLRRLREGLAVLKGAWAEGPFSYEGEHYRIDALEQEPRPLQRPHPPILIGGGGPAMLRLAAAEADIVNLTMRTLPDGSGPDPADGGAEAFVRKIGLLREAAGPRFADIELGTSVLRIGDGEASPGVAWSAADTSRQADTPQVLAGSVEDMADKLRRWRDEHGLSYFVLHHETDFEAFAPVVAKLAGS